MRSSANIHPPTGVLLAFPTTKQVPPPPRAPRSAAVPVAVAFALLLTGLAVALAQNQAVTAIRDLPSEARGRIFHERLSEVRSTCVQSYAARGPLRNLCVEEARLLLLFPECGPECRAAANTVLPHAHR